MSTTSAAGPPGGAGPCWPCWRTPSSVLAGTATTPPPIDEHPNDRVHNDGPKRIPLTRNEVQRLIAALISPVQASLGHVLHWSLWRRRAQTHARASHYRRQAAATG